MTSFFDDLDKRHRRPEPIRPERMTVGQDCPDPKCRGRMASVPAGDCSCHARAPCGACENATLACDCCGWEQGSP